MASTFAWGHWEKGTVQGQFHCVFIEAHPEADGMIRATGLYRAMHGESFDDVNTYEDRVAERAAVTIDGNGMLLVREEFAELLATLPSFLREVFRRFDLAGSRSKHQLAS